jgi:hypothetical protein
LFNGIQLAGQGGEQHHVESGVHPLRPPAVQVIDGLLALHFLVTMALTNSMGKSRVM